MNKEEWLDKLRTEIILLKVMRTRKKRIRNNILYRENQKKLFADDERKIGELPEIEKFEEYWSGIWEKIEETPKKPWMKKIEEELKIRVAEPQIMHLELDQVKKIIKKRKNWSVPELMVFKTFGGKGLAQFGTHC